MSEALRLWRRAGLRVFAGALCLAVSQAGLAQDGSEPAGGRSAADAQRFLAQLLVRTPRISMDYNLYRDGSHVSPVGFSGGKVVPASGEIVGVESPDKCKTRFALEQAQITQQEPGETHNFRLGPGISVADFTVDWSKAGVVDLKLTSTVTTRDASGRVIETVTQYPIFITMEDGWQKIAFYLPGADERGRLAVDVLKNSCRFQSDTGF
jgi:hypothetical protein